MACGRQFLLRTLAIIRHLGATRAPGHGTDFGCRRYRQCRAARTLTRGGAVFGMDPHGAAPEAAAEDDGMSDSGIILTADGESEELKFARKTWQGSLRAGRDMRKPCNRQPEGRLL